jgi:virginiamycin B lyase
MSERQRISRPQPKGNAQADSASNICAAANEHRQPPFPVIRHRVWYLLGIVLLSALTLAALSREHLVGSERPLLRPVTPMAVVTVTGTFREYPYPRPDNEVMRPAIDHQGQIWFGAMGQNALVVFDPHTRTFQYLTPPHGHHGIMGVLVAPDDTIWFAEQFANYIGHYFPTTGHYQLYPLPWLSLPDPNHTGHARSLPSAPNELTLDAHGDVWFTEFNADSLGRLDPQTGHIRQYPLSARTSVQTLYPYGVSIDPQGMVWFTEAGANRLGRLDPSTGALHLFAVPEPHALLMEIAVDGQGAIWVTSFTPGLLFRFTPGSGTFTTYTVPLNGSEQCALYGLLATRSGDIWMTILAANVIARLDVAAGRFIYYHIPAPGSLPLGLAMDTNHNLWFTGVNTIGKLRPVGPV